jgi:HK97 family phage major capsid protein
MPESLQQKLGRISKQFEAAFNLPGADWETMAYVVETYDTSLIAYERGKYYRVAMADDGEQATFGARGEWAEVQLQQSWVETVKGLQAAKAAAVLSQVVPPADADAEKTLLAFGGEVKSLGEGRFGGYLVRFSSAKDPDLVGDFFTKDTDFGDATETDVYYQHGLDPVIGKRKLTTVKAKLKKDDVGVWMEGELAKRDEYEKAIGLMVDGKKMGLSSGTAAHLVEREPAGKAHWIKSWPLGLDGSLTPTPAEPRNGVLPLKSYVAQIAPAQAGQPAPDGAQAATKRSEIVPVPQPTQEQTIMAGEDNTNEIAELKGQVKGLGEQLDKVLKFMEEAPAIRNSGHFSQDGGRADKNVKSFGDFLMAVKRGDAVRLAEVYGSVKDMSSETGAAGGYLVPTEHHMQLMQIAGEQSYLLGPNGVFQQPVVAPAGTYPALDQFTAPTAGAGNTAEAGKLTAAKRAQGGAYAETQPEFEQIKYLVNDAASGMVQAPKELRQDVASLETLLKGLISIAVKSKLEYYILRGNGVGEPLGILNAPAAIGIDADVANTWDLDDAVEIVSRHKNVSGKPSVWAIHPGTIVDIAAMGISSVNGFIADPTQGLRQTLLGFGLVKSEHLPQPDNSGHALLMDPGAYVLFVLGQMYIDFSEHYAFANGLDSWRFGLRCDGQPWMKGKITLADPQGSYTVSPFVYNNDA